MGVSSWIVRGFVVLLLVEAWAWAPTSQGAPADEAAPAPRAETAPGINLTMTPEEMSKIMYVEPNQTKTANLTVTNHAGVNDTVFLNLSVDFRGHDGGAGTGYNGSGWTVKLEAVAFELAGGRSRNVGVCVRGPKTGLCNDFIDVTIDACSTIEPSCARNVSFRVYLSFTPKFTVGCDDKVHTASWGGTTYDINVRNIGPVDIVVILNVTGPAGWFFELDQHHLHLELNETAEVTLTVIPPDFAPMDEVGAVTVTGRSALLPEVKDSVTTHTIACMCLWWELSAPDSETLIGPGEQHVFALQVSHSGNFAGVVNISLSLNLSSPDWGAALATDLVKVAGGETKTVNLTVRAPADAPAGSRLVARVIGRCPKGLTEDCTFTAVVKQVHAIGVISSPQQAELLPGATAACDITIYNNGNGNEKVRPEIPAAPEGLDVVLMWPNGTVVDTDDWAYLEARDHFNWRLVLSAAPGCIAGDYQLPAQIRTGDNSTLPFALGYRILRTYGLDLRTAEPRRTCEPGSRVFFTLVCENTGNSPENVTFSVSGLPAGWQTPVFSVRENDTGGRIELNPFGQVRLAFELAIPPSATCGTVGLGVTAQTPGGSSDPVRLFIDIKMPNLLISKIRYFPNTLRTNREVTITVTVLNTGDIPAGNVTVCFHANNKTAGYDRLERIPGGSNFTVTFIWRPGEGPKDLKFVVDPDNTINESDENDNMVRETVLVYPPYYYGEPGVELCLVPLPFLLLLVAIMYFLLRKE